MSDDATLRITTVVDTSQLEAGMQKATSATQQYTQSATMGFTSVKEAEAALADAQKQLGRSAAAGNAQAAAVIAEYRAAVDALRASVNNETAAELENAAARTANATATSSATGEMRTASATMRTLELNLQGSTYTAGRFLTQVLNLGPALQAAFPVVGAFALGEVLFTVGERVYTLYQNIVNLKSEIAALGEASEKTAKQAADANWKWIESQTELLKSQGKLKEAQEFLAAHAGEKPEALSLGVDTSKLKDLDGGMRAFAETLAAVHTQAQAQSAFKELDAQMSSTQAKIDGFKSKIADAQAEIARIERNPTGSDAEAQQITAYAAEIERMQHQITAYTEYYNTLQNLKNKNVSDSASEQNKLAQQREEVLRQQQALDLASLTSHKAVAEAKIAQDEELARRQLQLGEITEQQELARLAADTQKKLQLEIDYYSQLDAILSRDADKNTAEITRNQGRIQALKIQQHTEELKAQQDADAAALNEMLRTIDAEIQGTKQGSQERINLLREELALVELLYGQQGAEYEKLIGRLAEADRQRTAELQRHAEQQASEQAIRDKQRELDEANRGKQQELSLKGREAGSSGLLHVGQMESDFAAMKAAEEKYTADSIALAQQAAQAKIAALEKVVEAAELAALKSNDPKFLEQAQAAADKQVAIEQELQSKLAQLRQQGAERAKQIDKDLAKAKDDEAKTIARRMLSYEDQALFHSKNFSQAVENIYRGLAESAINSLLMLVNKWIAQHVVMELATRLFHLHNAAAAATANAQQITQTVSTNVATVTSEAAVAAAKAYAAYAYFPPLAAAMAAEAEATVLSFLPEAAAEGGFDVPFGSSPLTQLHPQEMVLPEHLANTVRNMAQIAPKLAAPSFAFPGLPEAAAAALRGDFGGSITNVFNHPGAQEPGGDFHYHAGDVHANALDRTGVGDVLRRHGADVAKSIMKLAKAGHFNRR